MEPRLHSFAMSPRVQRLLAAGAVTAGVATFGFAAGGLAGTDDRMRAAEARLASLETDRDRDCPWRDDSGDHRRPEL